jgi:hypothetical protein
MKSKVLSIIGKVLLLLAVLQGAWLVLGIVLSLGRHSSTSPLVPGDIRIED